jgi:glycosyltransferase involved in cell wall biosynthesis
MKLSYGLTVCNEHEEIRNLIEYLIKRIDPEDEIVVVYDSNRVTDEVLDVLNIYPSVMYHPFNFQQNFLENKNFLNSKCTGDYIFQIDADEIPEEFLIENLKAVLEANPVDLLLTPRKNLVPGLTENHIKQWGWRVTEQGWVNWPDTQKRIYRNTPDIKWSGHQVHGMVDGYKTFVSLPESEEWSIIHNKTLDRQEKQNERYYKIETGELK